MLFEDGKPVIKDGKPVYVKISEEHKARIRALYDYDGV